ncbi:hypothetical protein TNCV_2375791 [Trichonephila clavipes]|nr:hypothetical protein TNCV_2375791 [Trichonephila clavipes]
MCEPQMPMLSTHQGHLRLSQRRLSPLAVRRNHIIHHEYAHHRKLDHKSFHYPPPMNPPCPGLAAFFAPPNLLRPRQVPCVPKRKSAPDHSYVFHIMLVTLI